MLFRSVGVAGLPMLEAIGVGPPSDRLLCLLETDTLRRRLPYLRMLSVPALALELERPTTVLDRLGVVGVLGCLTGVPLCTSLTVSGSAPVPGIPMRKLSWFSIRNMSTS